jgi:hypothetical protein
MMVAQLNVRFPTIGTEQRTSWKKPLRGPSSVRNYSITSSARASSVGGIVMFIERAVRGLMANAIEVSEGRAAEVRNRVVMVRV